MNDQPPILDYEPVRDETLWRKRVCFWAIFLPAMVIGTMIIEPQVHTYVRGQRGDQVVGFFVCSSGILTFLLMIPVQIFILNRRSLFTSVAAGLLVGLLSWVPAYIFMFTFFG